ncbi:MAG: UPF0175 family protein [Bacteroidota bacterium]
MLTIPDDILRAAPVSEEELRVDIAVLLYQKRVPPGKAASVAGMDRQAFRHLLASRRVPVQYGSRDLAQDLESLGRLFPGSPSGDAA